MSKQSTRAPTHPPTLDERIRAHFPPGAIYHSSRKLMDTIYERRMREVSSTIRSKPGWMEAFNGKVTCLSWADEANDKELTDVEFCYVLDELRYYKSLSPPGSNIRLSAADGVWISDTLIDAEIMKKLREHATILESVPDRQKDWHPNSQPRVLNLIDPSLYPLVYCQSRLCRQSSSSAQASLMSDKPVEYPRSLCRWREILSDASESGPTCYLPPALPREEDYSSEESAHDYDSDNDSDGSASSEQIDDNGAVTIESYINNLHPVKQAALYPIIASIFSKFLSLLEQVVTDLVHPRKPGVEPNLYECYEYERPDPEPKSGRWAHLEYLDELQAWKEDASYVDPQPKPFVVPKRPISPYRLRGRRLQAIVKLSSIELTPEAPSYSRKDWSVVGLVNERIIGTGMLFYDVANIAPS
ncbi:hypothetical protein GGI08_007350, partial [Coemansia sp. S2]